MLTTILVAAALATPPIPLDQAKRAFEEVRLASEEDAGKLWGVPLYGPMLFVDPQTRFVVANVRDAAGVLKPDDGVFSGTLAESVIIANTATDWAGTRWTMVMWNSVGRRTVPRRRLLLHESFHRIQNGIGLPMSTIVSDHLDTLDGRYWLQLEVRALATALRASGEERKNAIADAVAFRARRRTLFPASENERVLENNEGLAEYTGWELRGTGDSESRNTLANALSNLDPTTTFSRSFAYSTGPAYGLLLDALAPGWTHTYKANDEMALVLASAAKITAADADAAAQRYGAAELRATEVKRDVEQKKTIARYRALLVDGPVIELPMGAFGFDPYTVTAVSGAGTVYGTFEVSADWGTFKTDAGALISADSSRIYIPAAAKDDLKLATGWKIVAGTRSGDLRVSR